MISELYAYYYRKLIIECIADKTSIPERVWWVWAERLYSGHPCQCLSDNKSMNIRKGVLVVTALVHIAVDWQDVVYISEITFVVCVEVVLRKSCLVLHCFLQILYDGSKELSQSLEDSSKFIVSDENKVCLDYVYRVLICSCISLC